MATLRPDQARAGAVGAIAGTSETRVPPRPGRYEIDTSCSAVTFRTRHLFGLAPVRGSFAIRAGTVDVAEPLADSGVHVQIDPASFRTKNGQRDNAVRSERLLDTDRYPRPRKMTVQLGPPARRGPCRTGGPAQRARCHRRAGAGPGRRAGSACRLPSSPSTYRSGPAGGTDWRHQPDVR
jgi:hypothetical protein